MYNHSLNSLDQLAKARTLDDAMDWANAELSANRSAKYDDALPDDDNCLTINPYLNDYEREDAEKWQAILDHENILLHGALGNGKSALGNFIIKRANYYYDKKVILDFRPKTHFDLLYMPRSYDLKNHNPHNPILLKQSDYMFFDKAAYVEQLARMGDASLGELANEASADLEKVEKNKAAEVSRLTGAWVSQFGMVHMQRAIMGLDEIKRYHFKMRQNDPFGIQLIVMYDILRHMHLCIVGMTAYYDDLDPNRYLPKVTIEIKCHKSELNSHVVMGDMYKVNWVETKKNRQFKRIDIPLKLDVIEPWHVLGGSLIELTQAGKETLPKMREDNTPDVKLIALKSLMEEIDKDGKLSLFNIQNRLPTLRLIDIMDLINTYPYLIKLEYATTELVADVDEGQLIRANNGNLLRKTDIILVKDTTGFRDENGTAWLESEYIGYALRTDKNGFAYKIEKDGIRQENIGIPNAFIGVHRRLNWRVNHCKASEHKMGASVYTTLGVGDIYNSWNAIGQPIAKSMKK